MKDLAISYDTYYLQVVVVTESSVDVSLVVSSPENKSIRSVVALSLKLVPVVASEVDVITVVVSVSFPDASNIDTSVVTASVPDASIIL